MSGRRSVLPVNSPAKKTVIYNAQRKYTRWEALFPGGDASHARIFLGPQLLGTGSNLVPVTLTFADVNGDQKPDMIILLQATGSSATSDPESLMFINTGTTSRPPTQSELPWVEKFLQHLRQ